MKTLIVEDEEKLAQAIATGLGKKGYTTDIIGDGEKALTRMTLHRDDYDVIILDLMLPSMNGHEIVAAAREAGVSTPILILTARAELENKLELLRSGADDYLIKPFSFEELLARLGALLRRPPETLPPVIELREITLDPGVHTVTVAGRPVSLTLKEFSLLEYLMRHPNQVVNREDLLSHLWDFNYDSFSNVVDVHVKNLRNKLSPHTNENLIETVRGIGYRIRA